MHLCFKLPESSCDPAIAKIMKKNSKMMRVSLSSGMALKRAYISTFKPRTLEIVFRGLITLKVLREPRENS